MQARDLRDHFSFYWGYYVPGTLVACFFASLIIFTNWRVSKYQAIAKWPTAQATVVESATQIKISDENAKRTIFIGLTLRYRVESNAYESYYGHRVGYSDAVDYTRFDKDRVIDIRYSPTDPSVISLYPWVLE